MSQFRIGDRVKVDNYSGLDSGNIGVIIPWFEVPTDNGIPTMPGYYRIPDRKKELPLRLEDGRIILMFRSRLQKV